MKITRSYAFNGDIEGTVRGTFQRRTLNRDYSKRGAQNIPDF